MAKIQIPYAPYPLQQEIIDHVDGKILNSDGMPYRFFVAVLGRQSGKSWLDRRLAVDHAVNMNHGVMWVAPTIGTARSHWNILKDAIVKSKIPCSINEQQKEIRFGGGGFIRIRSAIEPDNLRGEGLQLIIMDEAAFYRNGYYVWNNVVQPMVTATNGVILITTTPNGRNWVYDLFERGKKPNSYYKSWQMPSAASPYQDKNLLASLKEETPLLVWLQEYEAQFLAGGGGIFAGADAASIVPFHPEPTPELLETGYFVAGGDFGFDGDFSTFTVLHVPNEGNIVRQVYGASWTSFGPMENVERMAEHIQLWNPRILTIERNGIGGPLFKLFRDYLSGEDLGEERVQNPNHRVIDEDTGEEIILTSSVRSLMYNNTKINALFMDNGNKRTLVEGTAAKIENGRLLLLNKDSQYSQTQLNEISTFERKHTQSGMDVTYMAQDGYHDDCVSALYLATRGLPKPQRVVFSGGTPQMPDKIQSRGVFRGSGKSLNAALRKNNRRR